MGLGDVQCIHRQSYLKTSRMNCQLVRNPARIINDIRNKTLETADGTEKIDGLTNMYDICVY